MENKVCDRYSMKPWATLFELRRDPHNKNVHHVSYDFSGEEWYLE